MKILHRYKMKSVTNLGDPASIQWVYVTANKPEEEGMEDAILIIKRVLICEDKWTDYIQWGKVIRIFKGMVLLEQRMSLKVSTFKTITQSNIKI